VRRRLGAFAQLRSLEIAAFLDNHEVASLCDDDLAALAALPQLERLELIALPRVTGATIRAVCEGSPRLRELGILHLQHLGDDAMAAVAALQRLWLLKLGAAVYPEGVTLNGLRALGSDSLASSLTHLVFTTLGDGWATRCLLKDDQVFSLIADQFPNLMFINLNGAAPDLFDDASIDEWNRGFAHLARLERLVELDLNDVAVNDTGLKLLSRSESLANLRIEHDGTTLLTDEGLQHLANLHSLRHLNIGQGENPSYTDRAFAQHSAMVTLRQQEIPFDFDLESLTVDQCCLEGYLTPGPHLQDLSEMGVEILVSGYVHKVKKPGELLGLTVPPQNPELLEHYSAAEYRRLCDLQAHLTEDTFDTQPLEFYQEYAAGIEALKRSLALCPPPTLKATGEPAAVPT